MVGNPTDSSGGGGFKSPSEVLYLNVSFGSVQEGVLLNGISNFIINLLIKED